MPRRLNPNTPRVIDRPIEPPEGAEFFRLKRGGKSGPECTIIASNGHEKQFHPIAWFTVAEIVQRWGYDRTYVAQFSRVDNGKRTSLGNYRGFRLADPNERAPGAPEGQGTPQGALTPAAARQGAEVDQGLGMLLSLKSIVDKDSAGRIASAEAAAQANVQIAREAGDRQMQTLLTMLGMFAPKPNAGMSPEMELMFKRMDRTDRALEKLLRERRNPPEEEEEEEEEEDEDEDARVERFMKKYRKDGGSLAVVKEFMGEETVAGLLSMLPKIKARAPEFIQKYGGLLKAQLDAALEAPPPPVPPPAAAPPPRVRSAPPAPPPPKERPRTNGTMRSPPPPVPDEHSVTVE